ncbi:MAG: efflux RND transporter permease subunit, partial [Salinisphaera sp.]|nr:efflux RND transporter permease subunit [Salinisphaera sp.]
VLDQVAFSADTYPQFTGAALAQLQARRELIVHSLLAGGGILLLIFVALGRVRNMAVVLLNLPFALVGGVIAAYLTGATLSVGSLVGFVTLFGITVRNSIMLASHYRTLVTEEGAPWTADTAIRGANERLTAILITALVTALAMLPIAIGSDNPGREIMGPMAAIIIGGLVSSTILNLLVLPSALLRYGRFDPQDRTAVYRE